jgi:hypothetical protein
MMVAVPALIPVIDPDKEPAVAIPVDVLVHSPPVDASVNAVEEPAQTLKTPEMAAGTGLTVMVTVL